MKRITIEIENKEYSAAINLAARLEMKREFKKNIEEFDIEHDEESQYKFIYAVLKANNPKTFKYTFNEFLIAAGIDIILQFAKLFDTAETTEPGNVPAAKA